MWWCAVLVVLVACGGAPAPPDRAAAGGGLRAEAQPLGMNDVSILLPLPRDPGMPVLAGLVGDGAAMVDRRWYDALVASRGDIAPRNGAAIGFDDFQVVAVRFDLCDRSVVGPCPRGSAGRLRLVLQPMYLRGGATFAHDVALHAFYEVPASELRDMVGALRQLAAIQRLPMGTALGVSPSAAAGDAAYLGGLRQLVRRYARGDNLVRLTVIGQVAESAAFAWLFRGLDRQGDGFVPLTIPEIAATQQTAQLAGGDTVYRVAPMVDRPAGFELAINGPRFAAASPADQAAAVAALTEVQNPTLRGTEDTQCIGCHLGTFLMARRAAMTGIEPASLPVWYATPAARGVHTIAREDPRVVRAFGWAGNAPAISQRVVNDTAQALEDIEARYPVPAHPAR